MSEKFQNKYRISSARLQNWDYGANAMYFVTICTQGRINFFGEIVDGKIELTEIGAIAHQYWNEIPKHFPFVILDAFIVMPNHVHGIVIVDKMVTAETAVTLKTAVTAVTATTVLPVETPNLGVSTTPIVPPTPTAPTIITPNRQQTMNASEKWKPATLGVIMNQYKRIVTINARKIHADFTWQSRFYDHIIRNDASFQRISNYIISNPSKWVDDKFYQ